MEEWETEQRQGRKWEEEWEEEGEEAFFFFLGKCGREWDGIECECVKEVDVGWGAAAG